MRDKDYQIAGDFLARFFGETEQAIELRACPNIKGTPGAQSMMTRDTAEIASFCRRKDEPGMGLYFGVCTRRNGVTSGTAANVVECPALWVDIDCAKQGIAGADARAALEFLPHPPTVIVNSGGGLHAYWILEQAVDVSPGQPGVQRITAALRKLAMILAGDMQCAEVARILRLPGTMNSKDATRALYGGEPAVCAVLTDTGAVHDMDELCEWLEGQRTVLEGKVAAPRPVKEDDPFVSYARAAGYEPAIDIDAELAAMNYGEGHNGIHPTQLRVSMSMIARGYDEEAIVERLLAATEKAAPGDQRWNWASEERAIRKMIATGRQKVEERQDRPAPPAPPASSGPAAVAVVHDMAEARAKREKPKAAPKDRIDEISLLGSTVLSVWQDRHGPVMHSAGTSYSYEGGVWSVWDERSEQALRVMMQEACERLNMPPKTSLINAAILYVMNRPSLLMRDVEFDRHGLIVAEDGTIDGGTGVTGPHSPDHHAMFKVGASIEGSRACPAWLQFLTDSFADKDPAEVPEIIRTLQEWFGASLIPNKSRDLSKGLFAWGGSRTGKTQLSEVMRALLGRGQTSAAAAGDIGKDFGLQTFLGKRGWIADDAIGQDEFLDAERYKKIVTAEETEVTRKNKTPVQVRFGFPVLLTANHLPKVKDQSDAVYNRSLVLPMTNVRPESAPTPAGYPSISAKIIAEELTGVLWWAVEGWQRLSARGMFTPPPCMTRAVTEMQDNNNPIGSWLKECVVECATYKVANADLYSSFAGWHFLENGDSKFLPSQNKFIRRLREMLPNVGKQTGAKTRNTTGLMLNAEGLEYWSANGARDSLNAPKPASLDQYAVNQGYTEEKAERAAVAHETARQNREPRF